MNSMSMRERAIVAIVGVALAYALAVGLWFMTQSSAWQKSRKAYQRACQTYQSECRLISERDMWDKAYEEAKSKMPTFKTGVVTDTTWLQKMDRFAESNHVYIAQRQAGRETAVDEVLELPIDVRNWEGALESLVKFMYQLENTDEGMFDFSSVNFHPSNKRGYLKGSFLLKCAYMRDDNK